MLQFLERRQKVCGPTGPSGPVATPAPDRSPGDGRLPVLSRGLLAAPLPRSSPRGPAKRSSSRAGRHTPASPGSASPESAGHWLRRGHTGPPATFSPVSVPGRKRYPILSFERPALWAFRSVTQPWPQMILFGQAGFIILRGCGRGEPRQRFAVVPGHPLRWVSLQLLGVLLQLCQIVERINTVQLTSMDQTHEQIAHSGTVQRLVKEGVFPIQNRFLEGTLDDVMPTPGLCRVLCLLSWFSLGDLSFWAAWLSA